MQACSHCRGKDVATSDNLVAMFGPVSTSKQKAKKGKGRDYRYVTCFGCGKKGQIRSKEERHGEISQNRQRELRIQTRRTYLGDTLPGNDAWGTGRSGDGDGTFYIGSGASDYLIPSRGNLHAYRNFDRPVEISAADGSRIFTYGSGTLRVAKAINGLEREAELQDLYYTPRVYVRLVSLGKLKGQGWDACLCDGRMELRDRNEDLFADIEKANNVYPAKLKVISPRTGLATWKEGDSYMDGG